MNLSREILNMLFGYLARNGYSIQSYVPARPMRHQSFSGQMNDSMVNLVISQRLCKFILSIVELFA